MTKSTLFLLAILASSACAQQAAVVTESLYPYLSKEGLFGYADKTLHIRIKPQYKIEENGKYLSFYLHLPTLQEFREK